MEGGGKGEGDRKGEIEREEERARDPINSLPTTCHDQGLEISQKLPCFWQESDYLNHNLMPLGVCISRNYDQDQGNKFKHCDIDCGFTNCDQMSMLKKEFGMSFPDSPVVYISKQMLLLLML